MSRLLSFVMVLGLLLCGVCLVAATITLKESDAAASVQHIQMILRQEVSVLSACQDLDMASRGYALTKDPAFLDHFDDRKKYLHEQLKVLQVLLGYNPLQNKLAVKLESSIDDLITTSNLVKTTAKPDAVRSQKVAMDRIRVVLESIVDVETRLLQQRQSVIKEQERYLWMALGVQLSVGLCLTIAVAQMFAQYKRETDEKLQALEIANDLAQKARRLAENALESRSRFLATMSHEVRTPMAGVIGMAELLSLQELGPEVNSAIRMILDSSRRLLQILNNVLDAASLSAGAVQLEQRDFSVRSLIGDVTQLISPEALQKNLRVTSFCDEEIPEYVCGDEFRVRQVLLNLGFNAVKFTDKGVVHFKAELKERTSYKTVVRFSVADTGIGISPEEQDWLFEPFFQLQDSTTRIYGGTGLGLSNSKNLLKLMGGEIGVASEPGEGSIFWFDVPFLTESGET